MKKIREDWYELKGQLKKIQDFEIKRRVIHLNSPNLKYEIHGFCDSSQLAYGACIYLKCIDEYNNVDVQLLCAKSRVAPIKPITLPRLELCGALVLARLQCKMHEKLNLKISRVYLWSDSTIVLHWIAADASRWKQFVANRVDEMKYKNLQRTVRGITYLLMRIQQII